MNISDFKLMLEERTPSIMEVKHEFSILIPLVEKDSKLYVLFELRSADVRQPGEVCFPGGMREPGESREECAVRETMEELGVNREEITVLGEYDCLNNYTNITIYTFLGVLPEHAAMTALDGRANAAEVQEVFLVPLDFFQSKEPYIYTYEVAPLIGEDFPYEMIDSPDKYNWRKGTCTVPIYKYDGHTIWGITARILRNLLMTLQATGRNA